MHPKYHFVRPHPKRKTLSHVVHVTNVPKHICSALFGRQHSYISRMLMGVMVGLIGVAIAKYFGHSANQYVEYAGDAFGYGLHGMGLTPVIEYLVNVVEDV